MIAVYPLGFQSVWHNNELRYSIRSLSYYKPVIDKIILLGQCPEWINAEHIYIYDGSNRIYNIWRKMEAISEHINEPFLYMADDIFLTKSIDYMPMFYDGKIDKKIDGANGKYKDMLIATQKLLKYHNLPVYNFALHYPLIIKPGILKEALKYKGDNISFRLIYCNLSMHYFLQTVEERNDCKLWNVKDFISQDIFSISDRFLSKDGMALFDKLYPEKSIFEKE